MIDVPIAVRDALKDGGYKKNYRFVVGDVLQDPVWEHVTDLTVDVTVTITANGRYRVHCDTDGYYDVEINGVLYTDIGLLEDLTGGYYSTLGDLVIGNTVTIKRTYNSLVMQARTDETQEVFHPEYEIENDRLVKESVKIDERMCSDDTLKFGLCEGSSLEFQAFNIPNLTGKRLRAFVDVDYPVYEYDYDEETNKTTKYETILTFSIPMGWFDVSESSRQASTGIRKISAYNKLKAEYLDQQANALIIQEFGTATVRIIDIIMFLLGKYGIKKLDTVRLAVDYTYDYVFSLPKKDFHPYKYSTPMPKPSEDGQAAGMFNEYALWDSKYSGGFPANKNMYIQGFAFFSIYRLWKYVDPTTPVQIRVDNGVIVQDNVIAAYIQRNLEILETYSNKTAVALWNDIQHMKNTTKNTIPLENYFFYVKVNFGDGTYRFYGNHILNADGTFEQLGRTTFTNVSSIHVVTPNFLRYGWEFVGDMIKEHTGNAPTEPNIKNNVPMWGTRQDAFHEPPTMPDGSAMYYLMDGFSVYVLAGGYSEAELIEVKPDQMQNVTLRDLQTAVFETQCQFGKLDRVNNYFTGVELNNGRLYPKGDDSDPSIEALYPDDGLYPLSDSESGFKAMYSKLWADEGNIRKWKNLVITYKGLIENEDTHEHEEAEKVYTAVIDANGTDDYEVKSNWLFKNLLWADSESESWQEAAGLENVEDYADAMVAKMQSVSWFPFEMWCAGLPYVETGDEVEIHVGEYAYTSYVLRRTIKGIQNLQDEMINGTLDIF